MTARRTIVVGVGPDDKGGPALSWAEAEAGAGDAIRLVRAYPPSLVATAARQVAYAARQLRCARPDLALQCVALPGAASGVLRMAAAVADLLVVGAGSAGRCSAGSRLGTADQLLAGRLPCPLLVVRNAPAGAERPGAPVTVLLRDLTSDRAVVDVAFAEAARRNSPLVVLHPWQPPIHTDLVLAEMSAQKTLDGYLDEWQDRYPHVGVSGELRRGDQVSAVRQCSACPGVLVLADRNDPAPGDPVVTAALRAHGGPTLLVPQGTSVSDHAHPSEHPACRSASPTQRGGQLLRVGASARL